ncbi:ABC-2 type transport system permease protein [Nocardiopsis mwathae]|uniref:ABC-2 type transport system permease protein n=1 Tax=Nocardiopsis mwathae TaxID=1472723 RepID=A0A7W9YLB2_9ACTN|nr:ABC transporter permease [Nocardiopsis mwathae]MBB6174090.1 ABC-2 type transport system permease protein [Nocardiopsis mwathae]
MTTTATMNAVRSGLSRGWVEYRQSFTSGQDLFGYFGTPLIFLTIAISLGGAEVENTGVSVGAMMMAGFMGFLLVMAGVVTVAQVLAVEREDGTLLRAKALPRGMLGYFVGKSVYISLITPTSLLFLLLPAFALIDGFAVPGPERLFTFAWVTILGLLAIAPIGAIIGSLVTNPRLATGLSLGPLVGLMMISGTFFPVHWAPQWLQWIGQAFPMYWINLGMRSAFLPDAALSSELRASWQHLETAGVLGAWAVLGLIVAPFVLRRMARRESGARVQAAREKAMQRAY